MTVRAALAAAETAAAYLVTAAPYSEDDVETSTASLHKAYQAASVRDEVAASRMRQRCADYFATGSDRDRQLAADLTLAAGHAATADAVLSSAIRLSRALPTTPERNVALLTIAETLGLDLLEAQSRHP